MTLTFNTQDLWRKYEKIHEHPVVGHIWSQFFRDFVVFCLFLTTPFHRSQTLSLPAVTVPRWATEAVLMLKRHGAAAEVQVEGSKRAFQGLQTCKP